MAPPARHVSQTLAFVLATTATALVVEDLGKVFQLVGSTAGVLVICWVPAALLLVPPPAARASDAAAADGTRGRAGVAARRPFPARAPSHWTDGGGSIGGIDDVLVSGMAALGPGLEEDLAPAENSHTGGLDAPLLAASGAGFPRRECTETGTNRRRRGGDARRGLGLVLLGLVIAVSNVYLLLFTGEKDVTGEDPTAPAVLDRRTNAGFERK